MRKFLSRTSFIPLLIVSLVLIFGAALMGQMNESKTASRAFDRDLYDYHMAYEVTSLDELILDFEAQQDLVIRVAPPDPKSYWTQTARPCPVPFDPKGFPQAFLDGLIPATENGIAVYPVTVWEEPLTRERVLFNAEGLEITALPPEPDYDPGWYFPEASLLPDVSTDEEREFAAFLARVYDPSRLLIRYDLIQTKDLAAWVRAQSPEPVSSGNNASDKGDIGIMKAYNGAPLTTLKITAFERTNNCVMLTVGYPWTAGDPTNSYTNGLEFFACTNLIGFQWISLGVTNVSSSTNWIEWVYTETNVMRRFYAAGNADVDTDGDGLKDAREKYLYHTSMTNVDSDADGLVDGYSGVVTTNAYPGGAHTNGGAYVEGELSWSTGSTVADTDADGVSDGWEVSHGHNPLDPNDPPNVAGTISYSGRQTGTLYVVAVTASNSWSTNLSATLSSPGAFYIPNLPASNYWLKAWLDSTADGGTNGMEALGSFAGNPVAIATRVTGIDFALVDPDLDSDQLPDWWEVQHFTNLTQTATNDPDSDAYNNLEEYQADTDPANPASHAWTIGGTVSYAGPQAGAIHIVAYPSSSGGTPVCAATNATPGSYTITHLPPDADYWVEAWRDSNGDGTNDFWEAWGSCTSNPIYLNSNVSNIDLTLLDFDSDGDSLPDWFEAAYGLDPASGGGANAAGWWALDEASGTNAQDFTANTNNGTLIGSAVWTNGVVSNAVWLSGSNAYVQLTDSASLKPQYASVSVWIKPSQAYTSGSAMFFSKTQTGVSTGYRLGYESGSLKFVIYSSGSKSVSFPYTLASGVWHHVTGTYGGGYQRLYLDGVLSAQTNYSWGTGFGYIDQGAVNPRLGASADTSPSNYFAGALDDVRVYGEELTSNQVHAIYEIGADPDADGLSTFQEYQHGSNPTNSDTDGNGIADALQIAWWGTPTGVSASGDDDHDGMPNAWEANNGLNPVAGMSSNLVAMWYAYSWPGETSQVYGIDEYIHGYHAYQLDDFGEGGYAVSGYPADPTWYNLGYGAVMCPLIASSNRFVAQHQADLMPTSSLSIAVWLCLTNMYGNSAYVIDKGAYTLRYYAGKMYFNVQGYTVNGDYPWANQWVHVAAVYDGASTNLNLYFNGTNAASGAGPASLSSDTSNLALGHHHNPSPTYNQYYWRGLLGEVRFYNSAISESTVAALSEAIRTNANGLTWLQQYASDSAAVWLEVTCTNQYTRWCAESAPSAGGPVKIRTDLWPPNVSGIFTLMAGTTVLEQTTNKLGGVLYTNYWNGYTMPTNIVATWEVNGGNKAATNWANFGPTVYHLDLSPDEAYRPVGGTAATFTVIGRAETSTMSAPSWAGPYTWTVSPTAGVTKATNGASCTLTPGTNTGTYTLYVSPAAYTPCWSCDTNATLDLVRMDVVPPETNTCYPQTAGYLWLTNSHWGPAGVAWSVSTNGLSWTNNEGLFTFNPSNSTPGQYIVTAYALGWTQCCDVATVRVYRVEVLADTDRNGTIDDNDEAGKDTNTVTRGALITPPLREIADSPATNDLSNLATIRIDAKPTGPITGFSVRLKKAYEPTECTLHFLNQEGMKIPDITNGESYTFTVWPTNTITLSVMPEYARPLTTNSWPIHFDLELQAVDADENVLCTDTVRLNVTPMILPPECNTPQKIYSTWPIAGISGLTTQSVTTARPWTQDMVKFVKHQIVDGQTNEIFVDLDHPHKGNFPDYLRDDEDWDGGGLWSVSMLGDGGNIMATPPLPDAPLGKIMIGSAQTNKPDALPYWDGQGVQPAVRITTDWLWVGHVDELFMWVATNKVLYADPWKAADLLHQEIAAGHQTDGLWCGFDVYGTSMTIQDVVIATNGSGFKLTTLPDPGLSNSTSSATLVFTNTIFVADDILRVDDEVLQVTAVNGPTVTVARAQAGRPAAAHATGSVIYAYADVMERNLTIGAESVVAKIAVATNQLHQALSGCSATFVPMPVLFDNPGGKYLAASANVVNCLVGAGGVFYYSKPGCTAFETYVSTNLPSAQAVDVWDLLHCNYGEVHCATAAQRELSLASPWWQQVNSWE